MSMLAFGKQGALFQTGRLWRNHGFAAVMVLLAGGLSSASPAQEEEDWRNLYLDTRPVLDVRYRFEFVDQEGKPKDAKANTVRTRVGFETGRFYGLGAGFDFEWIEAIGEENFNDTVNGRTEFPTVADPDDDAVNQLYLIADGTVPDSVLKVGRQRIIWDNARFIGNVGFRQNEQTFDSLRASTSLIPDTQVEYGYLEEVHRIFGEDSGVGALEMDSHAVRVHYSGLDYLAITPFALLLDFDRRSQAGLSSQSYGVLLGGAYPLDDDWTLLYGGSFAYQEDFGDNPADFDLWYYLIEPGLSYRWASARLGYEVLQGDGTDAFQTPLATLHKFNGLTDQFLTTPPDGLEDLYLNVDLKLPGEGWLADFSVKGGYHQFWAEEGGSHYGWEWDLGLFKTFKTPVGSFLLGVQYADYEADNFSVDTERLWVTVQFKIDPSPLRTYLPE